MWNTLRLWVVYFFPPSASALKFPGIMLSTDCGVASPSPEKVQSLLWIQSEKINDIKNPISGEIPFHLPPTWHLWKGGWDITWLFLRTWLAMIFYLLLHPSVRLTFCNGFRIETKETMSLLWASIQRKKVFGVEKWDMTNTGNLNKGLFNKDTSVSAESHYSEETSLDNFKRRLATQLSLCRRPDRGWF